jgi:5-methylcytosine-specific restriction endonuclease McrA
MLGKRQKRRLHIRNEKRCFYCGRPVSMLHPDSPDYATVDHVRPLSRGGQDAKDNRVTACRKCNAAKKDMTKEEYRRLVSTKRGQHVVFYGEQTASEQTRFRNGYKYSGSIY